MRVISGIYRGKKLTAAPETVTRPTADRAKEGLFNVLNHLIQKKGLNWENIIFADVFAGSGAIGIEALSRGAKEVYFYENHPLAITHLKKNTDSLTGRFFLCRNALIPPKAAKLLDIYFSDAPYHQDLTQKALNAFLKQGWISPATIIILEHDADEALSLPACFSLKRQLLYGRNHFDLFEYNSQPHINKEDEND